MKIQYRGAANKNHQCMIYHRQLKCIFTFRVDKTKQDKITSRGTSEMK